MSPVVHAACVVGGGLVTHDTMPDARFPWWSFTKTLIAIAVLRLVEEGRLDLDLPLAGRPYTARHLLQHRAGVPSYGRLERYHAAVARGDRPWSRERLLEEVRVEGLDFVPGSGWAYSNVGYLFLRELVEEREGAGLAAILARRVWEPLGLQSVALAETPEDFARTCWGNRRGYHPGWVYHGCCIGTARDAAAIQHALVDGRLLGADLLAEMTRAYPLGGPLQGRPWCRTGYGLGLMIGTMEGVGRAVGHSGCGPCSSNAVYHFPDAAEPVTVAAFTDGSDEGVAEHAAVRLAAGG